MARIMQRGPLPKSKSVSPSLLAGWLVEIERETYSEWSEAATLMHSKVPIPTFESSTKQTREREKEDLLEDAFSIARGAGRPQIEMFSSYRLESETSRSGEKRE